MKNKNNKEDFIQIRDLIQKEKQAALPMFQKDTLRSRLNARIEAESKRKHFIPHWLRKPIPALGISFLLIAVAIIVVLKISVKSPYEKNIKVIEQFLQQNTHLQKTAEEEVAVQQMSPEYAAFEWQIKWVLFSSHLERISGKDLPIFFYRVLSQFAAGKEKRKRAPERKAPYMINFEREMEALKKEGKLHQFFSQILKKLEEV